MVIYCTVRQKITASLTDPFPSPTMSAPKQPKNDDIATTAAEWNYKCIKRIFQKHEKAIKKLFRVMIYFYCN